jgi:hypothetical protein
MTILLAPACCAVTAPQNWLVTALRGLPEEESFDDWLAPIAAKSWIADAQIIPDCLATKEQCSVYLSGISLLSPGGRHKERWGGRLRWPRKTKRRERTLLRH